MIANLWISMRPRQWIKNTLVFAALIFSQNLFQREMVWKSSWAFILFCLLSSSVYLFNDLLDAEEDRRHPLKRERPIAAGKVAGFQAMAVAGLLSLISICGAFSLAFGFGILCAGYLVLQILYSFYLKRIPIIEIFAIAAGFFLRVVGGAKAIEVPISSWLLICTLFFSEEVSYGELVVYRPDCLIRNIQIPLSCLSERGRGPSGADPFSGQVSFIDGPALHYRRRYGPLFMITRDR